MIAIARNPLSKLLRKSTRWLWARQTLEHLEVLRRFELDYALTYFPAAGRVLEIGGGTGWQAKELQARGYAIDSIDVADSNYSEARIFPVVDYDGEHIPFDDASFDVVFSSNVMEHIPHVEAFQKEIHRVLKPGGRVIHIMPSTSWRLWSTLSCFFKSWKKPEIHGEHAKGLLAEAVVFRQQWWRELFERTGWRVVRLQACPLFYTGCSVMDKRLSAATRSKLSRALGGSTNLFVLETNT